ncbi:TPA: hypothetical protein ACH3X3_003787 [Trebouxia sp. C0006]
MQHSFEFLVCDRLTHFVAAKHTEGPVLVRNLSGDPGLGKGIHCWVSAARTEVSSPHRHSHFGWERQQTRVTTNVTTCCPPMQLLYRSGRSFMLSVSYLSLEQASQGNTVPQASRSLVRFMKCSQRLYCNSAD